MKTERSMGGIAGRGRGGEEGKVPEQEDAVPGCHAGSTSQMVCDTTVPEEWSLQEGCFRARKGREGQGV